MNLGKFEDLITNGYSTTKIFNNSISEEIKVYLNPIMDIVNIEFEQPVGSWGIALYDINGKKLKNIIDTSAEISEYDSRIYFLVFKNGKVTETKELVKI